MSARPDSGDPEIPRGLPGKLPAGETLLWQGSPGFRSLARHLCHMGAFAAYFGLLLVWLAGVAAWRGRGVVAIATGTVQFAALAAVALGLLLLFAWLLARSTIYTVTTRRVVLRFGIAMPKTVNLPLRIIDRAGLHRFADGSGDLALSIGEGKRPAYVLMWPHVRPWRLSRPEPMLRCVPDAAVVAQVLGRALAASAAQPVRAARLATAPGRASAGTAELAA